MNVCLKAHDSIPTTRKSRVAGAHASKLLDADTVSGALFQTAPLPIAKIEAVRRNLQSATDALKARG